MKTLLLLDFDRTVFDLSSFLNDTRRYIWELPSEKTGGARAEDDILDIFERPGTYPVAAHEALEQAAQRLPHKNYVYKDASRLLKRLADSIEVAVITFGRDDRQRFKRRFAPPIQQLPFVVTGDNKGILLAGGLRRSWLGGVKVDLPELRQRYARIILIDDNPVSFLPLVEQSTPITMIHLARAGESYSEESVPPGVRRIATLDEFDPAVTR
jgi:hypothetical protein